jgi:prepilin-type N-terminal cleavage/methylation domain-containing protein
MKHKHGYGFTLVEVLVVIAILLTLAGILYASSGNVHERARQAVCTSNLRQIGQALAIYRQDYGGSDAPGLPDQMGFPPSPFVLNAVKRPTGGSYLTGYDEVFHCPSRAAEPWEQQPATRWCDYNYQVWFPEQRLPLPSFAYAIAERGTDFPIMGDRYHDLQHRDRPRSTKLMLVLRLDGRVSRVHVSGEAGWRW